MSLIIMIMIINLMIIQNNYNFTFNNKCHKNVIVDLNNYVNNIWWI